MDQPSFIIIAGTFAFRFITLLGDRMKEEFLPFFAAACLFLALNVSSEAGMIYQNFEPDLGTPVNIWSRTLEGHASVVDRHDGVHLGQNAARYESGWQWNGLGINTYPNVVDFKQTNNDRLTFWILAFPHVTCQIYGCDTAIDNTVGVEIHDNGHYGNGGVTVWTVPKARYKQWTKLEILFSQLPMDFNLREISQIQFLNFWPGKYYLDDFHAVRQDRVYQSFNQETRSGTTDNDYGWKWNDADATTLSGFGEPVYEGGHSWTMNLKEHWGGGGIKSQQENYFFNKETNQAEQSFWHNDFLPEQNDRLSLWIMAFPENGMDNNLNVQMYDHDQHSTDQNKAQFWNKIAARYGQWTRLEVPFKDLPADLNLHDIDKIQIQQYWKGLFYIDDIRATGPHPVIKQSNLSQGLIVWDPIPGAQNYRLQESWQGPDGPWTTIYSASQTNFKTDRLGGAWYRVRWEEKFADKKTIPYYSPWSDVAEYHPPTVNLKFNALLNGLLIFNSIPQASAYQLQMAPEPAGPWTQIYQGPPLLSPLTASVGKWYRARAIKQNNGDMTDFTSWSRPQVYSSSGTGFVKASGTVLKNRDGNGEEVILNGYNLGNYLLTEDWMTGFGTADEPKIPDEWTLRNILTARFGVAQAENLLRVFENAYLNDYDFDLLSRTNVSLVRLPIYYRNLMDENGQFILNSQGQIDFTQIDRVVDAMADRGIYTLLDLHGAPGSQNGEAHSGQKGLSKLFETSAAGEISRARTETLWKEIAKHYKNNTWVLGYDLLNEPVGAPNSAVLADFYDRLYLAIRAIDSNHVIMMEGIWDWETLPNPMDRNWHNVAYQFHYYCPMVAQPQKTDDPRPVMGVSCADYGSMEERFAYQKAFIDAKVANSRQELYQVPAMVGEFSAHDDKPSWDYYFQTFNQQKWSWTVWSYKDHSSPSNWGMVNHAFYDEDLPKFRASQATVPPASGDSYNDLTRKLSKYTTADYQVINEALKNIVNGHGKDIFPLYPASKPEILSVSPHQIISPGFVYINGRNFGAGKGSSTIKVNGSDFIPTAWSNHQIVLNLDPGQPLGKNQIVVTGPQGTGDTAEIIVNGPSPTIEIKNIQSNPDGTFTISGSGMCDTPGTVEFFPTTCIDNPPGSAACNHGDAAIISWSENLIKGFVPPDFIPANPGGSAKIHCLYGGPLYPTMIPENRAPVWEPIPNRFINEGQNLSFKITATDPDGDPLVYSVDVLPTGASFTQQTFAWTPNYNQSGKYTVTFRVSDGSLTAQQNVMITVVNVKLPDLIVTELSGPARGLTPGTISVRNTIKNQGQAATGGLVAIAIYLSKDPVITTSDTRIYSRTVTNLVPGSSNTLLSRIPLSRVLSPGRYYLGAIVDYNNQRLEQNENNNSLIGNAIEITK